MIIQITWGNTPYPTRQMSIFRAQSVSMLCEPGYFCGMSKKKYLVLVGSNPTVFHFLKVIKPSMLRRPKSIIIFLHSRKKKS
jgi:hypothetical protein